MVRQALDSQSGTLAKEQARVPGPRGKGWSILFTFFGGWLGVALFAGTVVAAISLFLIRNQLAGLGHLGYLGIFLIAFLGNVPVVPAFPWLLLIAPFGSFYPIWAIVVVGAIGAGLGELIPYFLSKSLYNAHKTHPWISRLSSLPTWARVLAVFGISLSPVFSCPGLASGVLRVRLWTMTAMKVTTEAFKLWLLLEAVRIGQRLLLH